MSPPSRAAWIEILPARTRGAAKKSPPSRAAWIEIRMREDSPKWKQSPPSRAAWIEISGALADAAGVLVAAFTGGVD